MSYKSSMSVPAEMQANQLENLLDSAGIHRHGIGGLFSM